MRSFAVSKHFSFVMFDLLAHWRRFSVCVALFVPFLTVSDIAHISVDTVQRRHFYTLGEKIFCVLKQRGWYLGHRWKLLLSRLLCSLRRGWKGSTHLKSMKALKDTVILCVLTNHPYVQILKGLLAWINVCVCFIWHCQHFRASVQFREVVLVCNWIASFGYRG